MMMRIRGEKRTGDQLRSKASFPHSLPHLTPETWNSPASSEDVEGVWPGYLNVGRCRGEIEALFVALAVSRNGSFKRPRFGRERQQ